MSDTGDLEGPDLVLSAEAVERLAELIADDAATGACLRIEATGDPADPGFTMAVEEGSGEDDVELDFARVAVVLDPATRRCLRGQEMAHRRDAEGEHFVIRPLGG